MKVSAPFKGMVTIDSDTFSYCNIRDMYKDSDGITFSSEEAPEYITSSLKTQCNIIAALVYMIEDIVDGKVDLSGDDKEIKIYHKNFSYYSYYYTKSSDITPSLNGILSGDYPEETCEHLKVLCDKLPYMLHKLKYLDEKVFSYVM